MFKYFSKKQAGQIVEISSIGALRGNSLAPAYNASKAFLSNYLEGLRKKSVQEKIPILVTNIKPGFFDNEMAKGESKFWVATSIKAAEQIYDKSVKAQGFNPGMRASIFCLALVCIFLLYIRSTVLRYLHNTILSIE